MTPSAEERLRQLRNEHDLIESAIRSLERLARVLDEAEKAPEKAPADIEARTTRQP
jgi:hypothetical protein